MATYIASQEFQMHNTAIRPGVSPSDLLMLYIEGAVLASGDATIDLAPYIGHAEVVSYFMMKRATSSVSGGTNTITAANDAIGDSATVDIMVVYRASKAQG